MLSEFNCCWSLAGIASLKGSGIQGTWLYKWKNIKKNLFPIFVCPKGTPWILQDSLFWFLPNFLSHQWTWPVIAINFALILKTSLPVSIFPGSCGFGYVQWKKPHLTLHDISQIQTLFSPSGVSFCLEGSDHVGTCPGRCSGNQIFTPGTGFLSFWREPWEWEALPHIPGTPAQCLCQQLAVGVWVKDLSVYIYMNIVDFIIISLQYLHIQLSDWLRESKQHPRGSWFVQVRHLL